MARMDIDVNSVEEAAQVLRDFIELQGLNPASMRIVAITKEKTRPLKNAEFSFHFEDKATKNVQ